MSMNNGKILGQAPVGANKGPLEKAITPASMKGVPGNPGQKVVDGQKGVYRGGGQGSGMWGASSAPVKMGQGKK